MKRVHAALLSVIVLLFLLLSAGSAVSESLTFDEPSYVEVGLAAWKEHRLNIEPYNPVLIPMVTTLPLVLGDGYTATRERFAQSVLPARMVTALFGAGTILAVYFFAAKYFGRDTALLSAFFLAFEPNFLANSHYITYDTGSTFFFVLAYWTLVRYLESSNIKNAVLLSVSTGMAFAAKIPMIPFIALSGLGLLIWKQKTRTLFRLKNVVTHGLFISIILALTVWATYFFQWNTVIAPSARQGRVSDRLTDLARNSGYTAIVNGIAFLKNQPVPLGGYLALVKNNLIRTRGPADTFFLGSMEPATGWYFMPVTVFLKTPVLLFVLSCLALVLVIIRKSKADLLIAFIPVMAVVCSLVFLHLKPFVRYALPIYPFLSVCAGSGFLAINNRGIGKAIKTLICLTYVAGTLVYYPHFIRYTNETLHMFGPSYRYLADSNLDWGQGLPALKRAETVGNIVVRKLLYFGRDNPNDFGFASSTPFANTKLEELCTLYALRTDRSGLPVVAISTTGWYYCGLNRTPEFAQSRIIRIVDDSFLLFPD